MNAKIYNSFLMRAFRSIPRRFSKIADKAEHGNAILEKVSSIDINIFPMFGTLLSITRDKKFLYADDFDFGIFDDLNFDLIDKFEQKGFQLCGASIVGLNKEVVELSFHVLLNDDTIKVDVFKLNRSDGRVRHKCPNFRKEKEFVIFKNNIKISNFNSYFYVDYPDFKLIYNEQARINCPSNPEGIFMSHYGNDWMIPKTKNFIDYEYYHFVSEGSETIIGDSINIKLYLMPFFDRMR